MIFLSYFQPIRAPENALPISDCMPDQLQILDPLSYIELLGMQSRATVVITDSGGI
jgi:UDP-N-acetylglucosamine 2-epimerase